MIVKDKVVSNWWYNLPDTEKDRYMIGRTWPGSIPERVALLREFYNER